MPWRHKARAVVPLEGRSCGRWLAATWFAAGGWRFDLPSPRRRGRRRVHLRGTRRPAHDWTPRGPAHRTM